MWPVFNLTRRALIVSDEDRRRDYYEFKIVPKVAVPVTPVPPVIPDTITLRSKRKASSESALSSTKFKVRTDELKIVPDPAKATGLKPPKDNGKVEPPPQPILEVQIVDGPKPDPVANLEQPILEAYLEQHNLDANLENPVAPVQQQNDGAGDGYVP